jgi:hypothetical protein
VSLVLTAGDPQGSIFKVLAVQKRQPFPARARMTRYFPTVLIFAICHAVAHASPLDALIAREKANRDNEAVEVYAGAVGKLDAVFFLEWDERSEMVSGYYYYPARGRSRTYRLEGTNPNPGLLLLREYSTAEGGGEKLSANCRLEKRVTVDRIIWKGQMHNTDGRTLGMSFSRPK